MIKRVKTKATTLLLKWAYYLLFALRVCSFYIAVSLAGIAFVLAVQFIIILNVPLPVVFGLMVLSGYFLVLSIVAVCRVIESTYYKIHFYHTFRVQIVRLREIQRIRKANENTK